MPDSALTDRDALRRRAVEFVQSDRLGRHLSKLMINRGPARWPLSLLRLRRQVFKPALCRMLAEKGRIVRVFVIMDSGIMSGGGQYCGPALVTGSLLGTDEGDRAANEAQGKITDLWLDEAPPGTAPEVEALLADDAYRPFRKRPLPPAFGGDQQVHLLDVEIDNELSPNRNPFMGVEFYFLVDPSPSGPLLQIPQ